MPSPSFPFRKYTNKGQAFTDTFLADKDQLKSEWEPVYYQMNNVVVIPINVPYEASGSDISSRRTQMLS